MGLAHNISYQLNSFCITSQKIHTKEKIDYNICIIHFRQNKINTAHRVTFWKKKRCPEIIPQLHNTDALDMQKSLEHFELSSNSDFKLVT